MYFSIFSLAVIRTKYEKYIEYTYILKQSTCQKYSKEYTKNNLKSILCLFFQD